MAVTLPLVTQLSGAVPVQVMGGVVVAGIVPSPPLPQALRMTKTNANKQARHDNNTVGLTDKSDTGLGRCRTGKRLMVLLTIFLNTVLPHDGNNAPLSSRW